MIWASLTKKQSEKLQLLIKIGVYPDESAFVKEAIREKLKELERSSKTKN